MTLGVLDIGEVGAKTGLSASTLRYYEGKGLIQSVGRKGLRRLFDTNVLETLAFIALGRRAGFSLDEISDMIGGAGGYRVDRTKLIEKAEDLDREIQQLIAVRDGLRHAAVCGAPSHMECPTFQRLLRLAVKTQMRDKNRKGGPSHNE